MQIAITGIGIVSALGIGAEANRKRLFAGGSALSRPAILSTIHREWPVGEVPMTNAELAELAGVQDKAYCRNVLLGLVALQQALVSAEIDEEDKKLMPLINGTTVGGMDITEQHYADWLRGNTDTLHWIHQHEAAETSRLLAQETGLDRALTISTACSSALNALIHGAAMLRMGAVRQVVVGGTEAMTIFHLNGFASLGILSEHICRPFAEDRDGINLGEGAAYLVLEEAECARHRGAHIYGYIAGYANRCDAYHQTASSPEGDGAYAAMSATLDMAGVMPSQIPYVNAHGTATPNNDASEWRAIERLFGTKLPVVESTKPLTGHTTSASGSIEVVFSLFRMEQKQYEFALSNAFGFGGNDSSVLLSRHSVDLPENNQDGVLHTTNLYTSEGEKEYKTLIPAMQARRMTPLLRQLLVVAHEALSEAGISTPDGIVVGTRFGGMVPTEQLLSQLVETGEHDFSPAQFMNSTHNCAAGTLARSLQSRGYNTTVVSSSDTFAEAKNDALLILRTGTAKSMLVCSIDEIGDTWRQLLEAEQISVTNNVKAQVIWFD